MERRVLLAITLSFLVLFLFQRFVMPPPAPVPQNASGTPTAQPGTTAQTPTVPSANATAGTQAPTAAPQAQATPTPASTVTEASAREVIVETSKVKATI